MIRSSPTWPMANYLAAWKNFRRLGNEPLVTAQHVLSQPLWPAKSDLRILDLGCGDGRMLEAFLTASQAPVSGVCLLDPEEELIREAAGQLDALGLGVAIEQCVGVADVDGVRLAKSVDVATAIHLVYLMPHNRFLTLVDRWPVGVPLYVVMDAPGSVFSEIWSQTAPEFAQRADAVHRRFASEIEGVTVRRTDFSTNVCNPFSLGQPVQNLVLSLLCYSDYDTLPGPKRAHVEAAIRAHSTVDGVACACVCYEVFRREATK